MKLWEIDSALELSIKGRFQRDENGDEVWVLTAKRAWTQIEKNWIEHTQPEIYDNPLYVGEEGFSALKHDHEFHISKQNTDVIVYAKARTHAKHPTRYHQCRLLVDGHIDKTIGVFGARQWIEHAGTISVSSAASFVVSNIDYSCAIGGDEKNRLGCGIATSKKALLAQPVPTVFYPNEDWSANNKPIRVAGFGAVPPFFIARLTLAGTFDENWQLTRKPLLPDDFNRAFFQSAPPDQQCKGHLHGGERIMLSGCSHDAPFSFRIPNEHYLAQIQIGDKSHQTPMVIHTVFIDAEANYVSITYSSSFPCQGQEHLLVNSRISIC